MPRLRNLGFRIFILGLIFNIFDEILFGGIICIVNRVFEKDFSNSL